MITFLIAVLLILGVVFTINSLDAEEAQGTLIGRLWGYFLGALSLVVIIGILISIAAVTIYIILTLMRLI